MYVNISGLLFTIGYIILSYILSLIVRRILFKFGWNRSTDPTEALPTLIGGLLGIAIAFFVVYYFI